MIATVITTSNIITKNWRCCNRLLTNTVLGEVSQFGNERYLDQPKARYTYCGWQNKLHALTFAICATSSRLNLYSGVAFAALYLRIRFVH